jgi:hypothetical protein
LAGDIDNMGSLTMFFLESILWNRFGQNLEIKPNLVKFM